MLSGKTSSGNYFSGNGASIDYFFLVHHQTFLDGGRRSRTNDFLKHNTRAEIL